MLFCKLARTTIRSTVLIGCLRVTFSRIDVPPPEPFTVFTKFFFSFFLIFNFFLVIIIIIIIILFRFKVCVHSLAKLNPPLTTTLLIIATYTARVGIGIGTRNSHKSRGDLGIVKKLINGLINGEKYMN